MNEVFTWVLERHFGPDYAADTIGMVVLGLITLNAVWRARRRLGFPPVWFYWFLILNCAYSVFTSAVCGYYAMYYSVLDATVWHFINVVVAVALIKLWVSLWHRRKESLEHPVYVITQLERKGR